MPPPDDDEITRVHKQTIGYLIARTHVLFRDRLSDALQGSGLHGGHVVILASLWHHRSLHRDDVEGTQGMTQTRLAKVSGIEKSSLVLFLDALEKDGWVERRAHPTDRRAHLVHMTDSGAVRFGAVGLRLRRMEDENLAAFSPAEQDQLRDLLTRLHDHMDTLHGKSAAPIGMAR